MPEVCFWTSGRGRFKSKATLVESPGNLLSDAGSIPAISTTLRGQVGEQPAVQLSKEHPCYSGVFLRFCTNYTLSWQADATQIAPDFGLDMLSQIW